MKSSRNTSETGLPLKDLYPDQLLWKHFLEPVDTEILDLPKAFQATAGLTQVFSNEEKTSAKFLPQTYAEHLTEDLNTFKMPAEDRDLVAQNIQSLVSGEGRAVVTGQQPGFAGGPLYSLLKISTAISLARLRTSKGLPSVPVFWLGDDDDDVAEALESVFWDGAKGELTSSDCPVPEGNKRQPMVGSMAFADIEKRTGEALAAMPVSDDLSADLKEIYQLDESSNLSLAELSELLIRRVFRGTGLVILRGNDSRLHQCSADYYNRAQAIMADLAQAAGLRAGRFANELGITPLGANSLKRPLYKVDGDMRTPWNGESSEEPSSWRCGVLLRSMLQDWLLKPVAVVVGPGELAYLSQLTSAYDLMEIPRAPLVPRLFGWVVSKEFNDDLLRKFSTDRPMDQETAKNWALEAGLKAEDELVHMLSLKLGVEPERARSLANGRTRRWIKGVQTMLQNESRNQWQENRPHSPAWIFPLGQRQERKLAWVPCVATWGQSLVDDILKASEEHLMNGLDGRWNEYILRQQEPQWWLGKGENS